MKHPMKYKRCSERQIRNLLNVRERDNLPIIPFCKKHKIHKATYYSWRKKYGIQEEATTQFIPVQLKNSESVPVLFGEIEFSSRAVVRLYHQVDPSWIKSLLS